MSLELVFIGTTALKLWIQLLSVYITKKNMYFNLNILRNLAFLYKCCSWLCSQSSCYTTRDLNSSFRTSKQIPHLIHSSLADQLVQPPVPFPRGITQIFPSVYLFSSSPLLSVSSQFVEKHFTRSPSDMPNQDSRRIVHCATDIHHILLGPKRAAETKGKNIHPRPDISTQNYSLYNPDA